MTSSMYKDSTVLFEERDNATEFHFKILPRKTKRNHHQNGDGVRKKCVSLSFSDSLVSYHLEE